MRGAFIIRKFCKLAKESGAKDAKVISTKNVFTASWVRQKCHYGCSGYGQALTCPPYSPAPDETRKILDSYSKAILIHCTGRQGDIKKIVVELERKIFLEGYHMAFGLGSGPCNLCNKCNLKQCKHPDKARPSMEACGIDVFKTVRKNGFKIRVVRNYQDKQNYFGLVLVE